MLYLNIIALNVQVIYCIRQAVLICYKYIRQDVSIQFKSDTVGLSQSDKKWIILSLYFFYNCGVLSNWLIQVMDWKTLSIYITLKSSISFLGSENVFNVPGLPCITGYKAGSKQQCCILVMQVSKLMFHFHRELTHPRNISCASCTCTMMLYSLACKKQMERVYLVRDLFFLGSKTNK